MRDRTFVPGLLTELRAKSGLTKKALAERSRLSYHFVKLLEAGVHQPSDLSAAKLASALNCHPHDFSYPKQERAAA